MIYTFLLLTIGAQCMNIYKKIDRSPSITTAVFDVILLLTLLVIAVLVK